MRLEICNEGLKEHLASIQERSGNLVEVEEYLMNLVRCCPKQLREQAYWSANKGSAMVNYNSIFESGPRPELRKAMNQLSYSVKTFVKGLVDDGQFRLSGPKNFHLYRLHQAECYYLFRAELKNKDLLITRKYRRKLKAQTIDLSGAIWPDLLSAIDSCCDCTMQGAEAVLIHKVHNPELLIGLIPNLVATYTAKTR